MNFFRIISSIAFCLLVLISSSSFVVGIHLCGGDIKDVTFFSKANSCANEKKMPPCHRHESTPCCKDQTIIHQGQDIKRDTLKLQLSAIPVLHIGQSFVLVSEVIPSGPFPLNNYNYNSPLLSTDLTVAHQVFLI